MSTSMNVILPEYIPGDESKYPVLFLLHGMSDDQNAWCRFTSIERYARERGIAVVMPTTALGWYTDMYYGYDYFTFISSELPKICRSFFPRMSDKREDTYVAGLSMGGRGACVYAFNHPEKFAAAAILSAAPRDFDALEELEPKMYQRTMQSVRNYGSVEAYKASYEYTWRIFQEKAHTGELPRLYFSIGMDDPLYPSYCHFKEVAEKVGLEATYEEIPGYRHEWRFWDLGIQKALAFFGL